MSQGRVAWADAAKGLSIILVVYGHAVDGVDADIPLEPWLFDSIMKPFGHFRMPLFFFVTGLFAAFSVRRDWHRFVDRTILHLVYVFIVWNILQYAARLAFLAYANHPIDPAAILWFPLFPINVTWFIWALIAYYLLLKLCRDLPLALVVAAAAILAAAPPDAGHYALENASRFFVFFLLGYALSERMLAIAWRPDGRLVAMAVAGYFAFSLLVLHLGVLDQPLLNFGVRVAGIGGVLLLCMWLSERQWAGGLIWLGHHTLAIFVTHTIITAGVREVLLRLGLITHPAPLIAAATIAGVAAPLLLQFTLKRLGLPWLFERPGWFRLPTGRRRRPATASA